jgi:tetratricopeptide (TPR) repeat protein
MKKSRWLVLGVLVLFVGQGCSFLFSQKRSFNLGEEVVSSLQIEDCKQKVIKEPSAENFLNLARVCYREERYGEAILAYKRVLEIDPTHVVAYYQLGRIYQWREDYNRAIKRYKKAVRYFPCGILYISLAECYTLKGEHKEALRYLRKYLAIEKEGIISLKKSPLFQNLVKEL